MAMEDRKCQMSWSSKNDSRMQSRLCSRDSAGVFWHGGETRQWGHVVSTSSAPTPAAFRRWTLRFFSPSLFLKPPQIYSTALKQPTNSHRLSPAKCLDTDLPRAETLEEEVEGKAPNHGGEQDAHQRQTLDPLAASQLEQNIFKDQI